MTVEQPAPPPPVVVLIDPQLGENIGTAARAMFNCALPELRLVRPRDGWPNEKARSAASGADEILDAVRLFDTTEEAVADLNYLVATTARRRDMAKPAFTPRAAAREMHRLAARGERCGILFGPERTGLSNDDVVLADALVHVPLNPRFTSLNLAQAVLLLGYEWFQATDDTPPEQEITAGAQRARREDILRFFEHLETELDAGGFLLPIEKRPVMVRNIRNLFQRAGLLDTEVQTLRGMIRALTGRRQRE